VARLRLRDRLSWTEWRASPMERRPCLVDPRGIEPPTPRLRGGCSAIELRVRGQRAPSTHAMNGPPGNETGNAETHVCRAATKP
jgi:hypothetical protein